MAKADATVVAQDTIDSRVPDWEGGPEEPYPGDGGVWPAGWMKRVYGRLSKPELKDRYWYAPDGTKFRSMAQVKKFLREDDDDPMTISSPSPPVRRNSRRASTTPTKAVTATALKSTTKSASTPSPGKKKRGRPSSVKSPGGASTPSSGKKKRGRPSLKSPGGGAAGVASPSPSKKRRSSILLWKGPPDDDLGDDQVWPDGWMKHIKKRTTGQMEGKKDPFWVSPAGRTLRSMNEVRRYLQAMADTNNDEDAAFQQFKKK